MPKCGFNKVALQRVFFSCKFAALFSEHLFLRTPLDGCMQIFCFCQKEKSIDTSTKSICIIFKCRLLDQTDISYFELFVTFDFCKRRKEFRLDHLSF